MNDNLQSSGKKFSAAGCIIIIIVFMAISTVPFILALKFFKNADNKREKACTELVQAEVIDNVVRDTSRRRSKGHAHSYAPVYRFEYKGETYEVTSNTSLSKPFYEKGEKADIKIDPNDPKIIYDPKVEEEFSKSDFSFLIYVPIGFAVIILLGLLAVIKQRRRGS